MNGYGRHVLHGLIAGLATGLLMGLLTVFILTPSMEALMEELVKHQLSKTLPPNEVGEALEVIKGSIKIAVFIAPIAQVIQYILLGALFGLVKGLLNTKLRLSEASSAIAVGALYVLLLSIAPLVVLFKLEPGVVEVISRYFNPYLITLTPGAVFAVTITLVSIVKGPWTRVIEAKPREV
ncbi:MAG: hypothetical protein RMI83_06145 [Desulfurococcaceae archaeon]|nr:hypothetical protein [Sulfolobales archaeon]MDW8170658.1 hypothetical protein [Desulfurococcaceae archaeon]